MAIPKHLSVKPLSTKAALILASLLLSGFSLPVFAVPDVDAVESSIVRVVIGGHGTGWVVSPGVVATNWHVAEGTNSFEIYPAGTDDMYPGTVRWIGNSDRDIALIDVPGLPLEPFTIHTTNTPRGSLSYTVGFPGLGDDLTGRANSNVSVYGGTIALIVENTGGVRIIQHTNIVNAGNSGGPLLDNCGRVLGLTTWGVENEDISADFIWASVHVGELAEQMDVLGIPYTTDETACVEASAGSSEPNTLGLDNSEDIDSLTRQVKNWGTGLGIALAFTLLLALRRPRQKIIHAIEQASRVVQRRSRKSSSSETRAYDDAPSPAAEKQGLVLSSSDNPHSSGRPTRIELDKQTLKNESKGISLGRAAELVDYSINDDLISRRHIRFSWQSNQVNVEDLNSTNGTFVNGKQLTPYTPVSLNVGDTIKIGDTTFAISQLS